MRAAADTMRQARDEARAVYQDCMAQGNTRETCYGDVAQYWLSKFIYQQGVTWGRAPRAE